MVTPADFKEYDAGCVGYHMELIREAGLVLGYVGHYAGGSHADYVIDRLTFEGHDFLDAIRGNTVWSKTKERFGKAGVSMTFETVKVVASEVGKLMLRAATA